MGGEAEAPRVGDALAVEKPQVRPNAEAPSRAEEDRALPEREVAGNVGERHPPARPRRGHGQEARKGHHGDAGKDRPVVSRECAVGAGDEPNDPRPVPGAEPLLQRNLNLPGFADR